MNTYEVKKFGVSLFMGASKFEAEKAFEKTNATHVSDGYVYLYHIVGGKKQLLRRK